MQQHTLLSKSSAVAASDAKIGVDTSVSVSSQSSSSSRRCRSPSRASSVHDVDADPDASVAMTPLSVDEITEATVGSAGLFVHKPKQKPMSLSSNQRYLPFPTFTALSFRTSKSSASASAGQSTAEERAVSTKSLSPVEKRSHSFQEASSKPNKVEQHRRRMSSDNNSFHSVAESANSSASVDSGSSPKRGSASSNGSKGSNKSTLSPRWMCRSCSHLMGTAFVDAAADQQTLCTLCGEASIKSIRRSKRPSQSKAPSVPSPQQQSQIQKQEQQPQQQKQEQQPQQQKQQQQPQQQRPPSTSTTYFDTFQSTSSQSLDTPQSAAKQEAMAPLPSTPQSMKVVPSYPSPRPWNAARNTPSPRLVQTQTPPKVANFSPAAVAQHSEHLPSTTVSQLLPPSVADAAAAAANNEQPVVAVNPFDVYAVPVSNQTMLNQQPLDVRDDHSASTILMSGRTLWDYLVVVPETDTVSDTPLSVPYTASTASTPWDDNSTVMAVMGFVGSEQQNAIGAMNRPGSGPARNINVSMASSKTTAILSSMSDMFSNDNESVHSDSLNNQQQPNSGRQPVNVVTNQQYQAILSPLSGCSVSSVQSTDKKTEENGTRGNVALPQGKTTFITSAALFRQLDKDSNNNNNNNKYNGMHSSTNSDSDAFEQCHKAQEKDLNKAVSKVVVDPSLFITDKNNLHSPSRHRVRVSSRSEAVTLTGMSSGKAKELFCSSSSTSSNNKPSRTGSELKVVTVVSDDDESNPNSFEDVDQDQKELQDFFGIHDRFSSTCVVSPSKSIVHSSRDIVQSQVLNRNQRSASRSKLKEHTSNQTTNRNQQNTSRSISRDRSPNPRILVSNELKLAPFDDLECGNANGTLLKEVCLTAPLHIQNESAIAKELKDDSSEVHLGKIIKLISSGDSLLSADCDGSLTSCSYHDPDELMQDVNKEDCNEEKEIRHEPALNLEEEKERRHSFWIWCFVIVSAVFAGIAIGLGAGLPALQHQAMLNEQLTKTAAQTQAPTPMRNFSSVSGNESNFTSAPSPLSMNESGISIVWLPVSALPSLAPTPTFPPILGFLRSPAPTPSPLEWDVMPEKINGQSRGSRLGELVAISGDGVVAAAVQRQSTNANDTLLVFGLNGSAYATIGETSFGSILDIALNQNGSVLAVAVSEGVVNVLRVANTGSFESGLTLNEEIGTSIVSVDASKYQNVSAAENMTVSLSADGTRIGISSVHAGAASFQVAEYDMESDTWVQLRDAILFPGRHDYAHSDLSGNGAIFAVCHSFLNGSLQVGSVDVYEIDDSNGWTNLGQSIYFSQVSPQISLSYNGLVMTIANNVVSTDVYRYDRSTNHWSILGLSLPAASDVSLSGTGLEVSLLIQNFVNLFSWNGTLMVWQKLDQFEYNNDSRIELAAYGNRVIVGDPSFNGEFGQVSFLQETAIDNGGWEIIGQVGIVDNTNVSVP